jgi:SAM-dependent MidA family methyltransferase
MNSYQSWFRSNVAGIRGRAMPSWIAEIVRSEGGRISFERFMELALYHPIHGYYTRQIKTVGRSGDFSTALTIGDALIRSVAAWVKTEADLLALPVAQIIELGGGAGQLASGVLRTFSPWQRVRYQIVEISRALRQVQERNLRGKGIRWQDSIEAALRMAKGQAILISIEFVDAFPCKRFERTPEAWAEIFLDLDGDIWREEYAENKAPLVSSALAMQWTAGQRIEVFQSYRNWLIAVNRHLQRGALLTIDYGGSPTEIYHRKPGGTMRAYFRHQRIEGMGIYLRPGRQDLTADVNFVDLQEWGEHLGLKTVQSITQADFIREWDRGRSKSQQPADRYISDESGMGKAIKVLHQRKLS